MQPNAFRYRIGIDLGGTKTEAILLDPNGQVQHRIRTPTPRQKSDPAEAYASIIGTVADLVEQIRRHLPQNTSFTVGVGIPGTINAQTQRVQNANTTCLIGKTFQSDLEQQLGLPIGMENDANCFTLAEALQGAGRGYPLIFGIIMGTGCGGGLSIQGRLHSGRHLIAGEWGHLSIDPQGAPCYCGNRGCVETKISGSGVEETYYRLTGSRLKMQEIVRESRKGQTDCRRVFEQFLDDFGRCLGGLISILDPDAVVLGGGLSNIDELYATGMERVRQYAFHEHVETPILKNQLGDSSGVFGAAWIGR